MRLCTLLFILQDPLPGWEDEDWEFFLDVWTAIALGKQIKGINRGTVDANLAANWKRHFTNYASKEIENTSTYLRKARDDLDKQMKSLPAAMKDDLRNKRVSRANVFAMPKTRAEEDKKKFTDQPYAQFKIGDPR